MLLSDNIIDALAPLKVSPVAVANDQAVPVPDNVKTEVPSVKEAVPVPLYTNVVDDIVWLLVFNAPLVSVIAPLDTKASCSVQSPPAPLNVVAPNVLPATVIVFPVDVAPKVTAPVLVYVIPDTNVRLPNTEHGLAPANVPVNPVKFKFPNVPVPLIVIAYVPVVKLKFSAFAAVALCIRIVLAVALLLLIFTVGVPV